jgi:hypothetical protein
MVRFQNAKLFASKEGTEIEMLRIGNKERYFSKIFTVNHGEEATLFPPEMPNTTVIFRVREKSAQKADMGIGGVLEGRTFTFELPHVNQMGSASTDIPDMGPHPQGPLSGRVSVQFMGTISLIVFEVYLRRSLSFAP